MSTSTTYEKLPLQPLFDTIEELKPKFIERLQKAIAIPSVSSDESLRPKVVEMANFLVDELKTLGFTDIQLKELGTQPPPVQDANLQLPPIVLGRFGNDPAKKTVLVYGHYDVQPALKDDGWKTEPFTMHYDKEKKSCTVEDLLMIKVQLWDG